MDLSTITMSRNDARRAFLDYKHSVKDRHDAEDAAIMAGYRAMSQGKQLLHLRDTLRAGGLDDRGFPRLAVTRADYTHVRCEVREREGQFVLHHTDERLEGRPSAWHRCRKVCKSFSLDGMETPQVVSFKAYSSREAVVPIVPAPLRPKHHLRNYHILWEAEWGPVVPKDPALLKQLHGDLYVVLAVWDLTPLEQAVLGGRLR